MPLTIAQAQARICPFTIGSPPPGRCLATECMAWRTVHALVEREDHSGARDKMNAYALETHRHVQRRGPPGSLGILYLEETGECARLTPHPLPTGQ